MDFAHQFLFGKTELNKEREISPDRNNGQHEDTKWLNFLGEIKRRRFIFLRPILLPEFLPWKMHNQLRGSLWTPQPPKIQQLQKAFAELESHRAVTLNLKWKQLEEHFHGLEKSLKLHRTGRPREGV
ncbi:hypothetical protein HAX54_051028 [Datura stramonium]|uniref:Uncharacterized protein n=1 Tax=Datura stramonium TaxID=4076 RepID=A0ABS8RRJ0_DATST|nr:hypothetical protein [Datura stramonium]